MKDQGHITVGHLMIFGPPIQETPKCTQVQWPLVECPGFSGDILRQTPSNMTWHGHRCSLWVCIFRGYPPMHFFWRHGKHPMVICNFPWFPRGFPMISYKAWGLWLDVFSLWCPSTGFWITSWATRRESDGMGNDQGWRQMVARWCPYSIISPPKKTTIFFVHADVHAALGPP